MSVFDRLRLDGMRLLITGGSRGLGREMALAIAEAGADVILVARDAEQLDATANEIRRLGRHVVSIACDVGLPDDCQAMCERTLLDHGPIDILINNVGGRRINMPTTQMSLEKWQEIMHLNLTATFLCTKLIGGAMIARARGGRVINVASISGLIVNRGIGGRGYETSKAAVIQFTRATAADWARHGVTVNAICPGFFMTEPNDALVARASEANGDVSRTNPHGRFRRCRRPWPPGCLPRQRRSPLHHRCGHRDRRRIHAVVNDP